MSTRTIPLACADFTFPLLPHDLALDLIAGLGLEGVDVSLMPSNAHLPVEEVWNAPQVWGRRVADRLQARGLALADVNFTPGFSYKDYAPNDPDPAARDVSRDRFLRTLDFTAHAGGGHVTLLPGILWPDERPESSFARAADELAWRVERARALDLIVSFEPHIGSLTPTPAAARALVEATPDLTLTLDYTHFVREGATDEDCEPLLPHASHFHARGGRPGRLQTSLTTNTIDYARVLRRMKEVGYAGYFALEYVWIDWEHCNDVDTIAETVRLRDLANAHR